MIATRTEIKTLLKITDSTYDALIDMQIPIVDQTVCDYCSNDFLDYNYNSFASTDFVFSAVDNSISLSGIGSKKLVANDTIRVHRSLRNDGLYTIDNVSTNKIIVNAINSVYDEDEGEGVSIYRIKYPIPLKMIAARMIDTLLNRDEVSIGTKSEKIDDYSITYEDSFQGFPMSVMSALNTYRNLYKRCDVYHGHR